MRPIVLVPASALALCAFCATAGAMSTAPYPGTQFTPERNGLVRNPNGPGSVNNPSAYGGPVSPYRGTSPNGGPHPNIQNRSGQGFLNIDPFDPNSVANSYDRRRYANPYPYDPIYNPYGQSGNVPFGQGIPYGR